MSTVVHIVEIASPGEGENWDICDVFAHPADSVSKTVADVANRLRDHLTAQGYETKCRTTRSLDGVLAYAEVTTEPTDTAYAFRHSIREAVTRQDNWITPPTPTAKETNHV